MAYLRDYALPPLSATWVNDQRFTTERGDYSELHSLVDRTFLRADESAVQVLAFAGVKEDDDNPGEVAAKVAEVITRSASKPVCLVDVNFASPSLEKFFTFPKTGGLLAACTQPADAAGFAIPVNAGNLFVLGAGTDRDRRSPDSFAATFPRVMQALKQTFPYIVLVSPGARYFANLRAVALQADGCVLVLEAGTTRRNTAVQALQDLQSVDFPVLGAVLNRRVYPIPKFIYRWL